MIINHLMFPPGTTQFHRVSEKETRTRKQQTEEVFYN